MIKGSVIIRNRFRSVDRAEEPISVTEARRGRRNNDLCT